MRKQSEITSETASASRDIPIKADEHATGELSDETLDKVTGGTVRKAGSGTTSGGGVYLRYTFGTVFTTSTR
jgi:hypothetical protein